VGAPVVLRRILLIVVVLVVFPDHVVVLLLLGESLADLLLLSVEYFLRLLRCQVC